MSTRFAHSPLSHSAFAHRGSGEVRPCSPMHPVSKPTDNPERDRQTLDLLVQGHQEGLQNLIQDHGPYVRAYVKRKLGQLLDHWQIEETMSLASLRAWQSSSRFDPSRGRLRAWFAIVARNCGLSLIAQHQGQPFVSIDGVDPTVLGVASGRSEARRMQMVVDVHRAIGMLPQLQRSVLFADLNAGTTLPAPLLAERFRVDLRRPPSRPPRLTCAPRKTWVWRWARD